MDLSFALTVPRHSHTYAAALNVNFQKKGGISGSSKIVITFENTSLHIKQVQPAWDFGGLQLV